MRATRKTLLRLGLGALGLTLGGLALFSISERDRGGAQAAPDRASAAVTPAPPRASGLDSGPAVAVESPEEVRELVRRCAATTRADEPWLRQLALSAEDPLVAGQAVQALGRLGLFRPEPELLGLLDDPRPRVAQEALRALGLCDDPDAVQHVAPHLADPDPSRRALAIQALGRLPGDAARAALESYQRDGEPGDIERAFLRAALGPEPLRVVRRADASRTPVEGDR